MKIPKSKGVCEDLRNRVHSYAYPAFYRINRSLDAVVVKKSLKTR
jgi:hypothetical protein